MSSNAAFSILLIEDDDVAAECVLHIPRWIADARLPVEPGFAQQIAEEPRVDIAAVVMAHIDDESLAVEDGVIIARPLIDVARAHGLQMDIADVSLRFCVDLRAARVFPLCVAHARIVAVADGLDDNVVGFAGGRLHV